MTVLDCRGLPCPQPVMKSRDFIAASPVTSFQILVDNEAAVQNVTSFLTGRNWKVESRQEESHIWRLHAEKLFSATVADVATAADAACACQPEQGVGKTLVFIPTPTMGRGDETLGEKLMVNFLATLPELGQELWRIILVNGGVKLAASGPAVEKLQALEAGGASILVCGTCLDHYGLLSEKKVGATTNMLDIVTSLQLADKVIRV